MAAQFETSSSFLGLFISMVFSLLLSQKVFVFYGKAMAFSRYRTILGWSYIARDNGLFNKNSDYFLDNRENL